MNFACSRPILAVLIAIAAASQTPGQNPAQPTDLARIKQEEAREKLERLEEAMDRLSRVLSQSEPQNAAKLKLAFRQARERLVREGMDHVIQFLKDRKLDRAIEEQGEVQVHLQELLDILLEKDIDPRELLKHIRKLRDTVQGLDKVIQDETKEKMASDDAHQAGASTDALRGDLEKLEDLIRREKQIEKGAKDADADKARGKEPDAAALKNLAKDQDRIQMDTKELRQGDEARDAAAKEEKNAAAQSPDGHAEGQDAKAPGGAEAAEGAPKAGPEAGTPGTEKGAEKGAGDANEKAPEQSVEGAAEKAPEPPEAVARPESVLDKKSLERAEVAMSGASEGLRGNDPSRSSTKATEARTALEEAIAQSREKIERLRAQRDFPNLQKEQDRTKTDTDALAKRMEETPPLIAPADSGVPGREDVEAAAGDMQKSSKDLGQGQAGKASKSQAQSLNKLRKGREKAEETLEELQRALRERLLAYLREKFTKMLNEQRAITRETKSLDLKLRALRAAASAAGAASDPEIDRKDRQLAENLSSREMGLTAIADDVIDLLEEDGTTLVFPGVVVEVKGDVTNTSGLLARIETGEKTQRVQGEIEAALEDILKALETAQRSPPPPNPNQGRSSKSGAGPLLPLSSELKMVRALQARVNERTQVFDANRKDAATLAPEEKLQIGLIQTKQKEVEDMLRKLREAVGEQ